MLKRCYFAQYERLSKKILKYRVNPPLKLIKEFEKVLTELRRHLADNNINIKMPKYPYNPEDKTTHSHIREVDSPFPIPNPNYIYKDTWVRVDGRKGIR